MFQIIDPKKFFNTGYIFEKTPAPDTDYLYLIFLFGFLIIAAFAAWFGYGRLKKKLPIFEKMQTRVFNLFFYTGITGLLLIFFRWQEITYLGSRFFMLILLVVFIIWGSWVIYFSLKILPKARKEFEARQKFEKYLPRPRN